LASEILANTVLHTEIREKGGAYGGDCKPSESALNFFSYRDPNFSKTYEAFNKSVELISEGKFE
jgi:Zn-dependent M16 (insulinase) family peptidase